jgi:hypothetical protein
MKTGQGRKIKFDQLGRRGSLRVLYQKTNILNVRRTEVNVGTTDLKVVI